MESTKTSARRGAARTVALVTALLMSVLGLSVPTAAYADNPPGPSGPYTVSGTIAFPAGAPSSLKGPINQEEPDYLKRRGIYLSLVLAQEGTSQGWWLEKPGNFNYSPNVSYNPTTGAWAVSNVGNGTYWLSINVLLPGNGSAPGTQQKVTVNNGNLSAGTTSIKDEGRLKVVSISCASALTASAITAKNKTTGQSYPIVSSQSGWMAPHAKCGGEAVYANYHLEGAPAGDYTVSFSQQGITEYYTGGDVGTLDPTKAATVTAKSWEGTQTQMMYGLAKPIAAKTPTISGTVKTGSTLKVSAGSWTSGASFTYQWQRNGASIANATRSSYKLTSSDVNKRITVRVTGVRSGYWPAAKTSAAVLKTATPKIRGTKKVGKTLKVSRGSWTTGTKFSYRWYRNGKAIKGATKSSYKLKQADASKRIKVKVTGKNPGYATKTRSSSSTSKVRR